MSSILNLRIGNETSTKILQDDVLKHQGNDKLFKVVKQHTAQEDWKPGIDTASLYTEIVEDHAGTLEDPYLILQTVIW